MSNLRRPKRPHNVPVRPATETVGPPTTLVNIGPAPRGVTLSPAEAASLASLGAENATLRAAIGDGTPTGCTVALLDEAKRLGFVPNFSSGPDGDPLCYLVALADRLGAEVAALTARCAAAERRVIRAAMRWYRQHYPDLACPAPICEKLAKSALSLHRARAAARREQKARR